MAQPRTHRNDKAIALKTAEFLKQQNLHAEITVHDLATSDTVTMNTLPPGYDKP
jgi:hypothetical protein